MFNRPVTDITLASPYANDIFPNISGECYDNDYSFLATLRALLAPRIKADDRVEINITDLSFLTPDDAETHIKSGFYNEKSKRVLVVNISGRHEDLIFTKVKEEFPTIYSKFRELQDLSGYISKELDFETLFYINEEIESVVIFVRSLDLRKYHTLQLFVPRYFPQYFHETGRYFSEENKLTDKERELLKSLSDRSSTRYYELIEQVSEKYDFRTPRIKHYLNDFETRGRNTQIERMRESIAENKRQIDNQIEVYKNLIIQRDDYLVREAGLIYLLKNKTEGSEVVDYFLCNQNLDPLAVDNFSLDLIISCYLENFDMDLYECIRKNDSSYLYDLEIDDSNFYDENSIIQFLNAVFSDEAVLKIKMCAYYCIDIRGSVRTSSDYSFPIKYSDRMPNPHLQYHGCLGQHQTYIEECLLKCDTIGAIEQCVSSAGSLNLGEEMTARPFIEKLLCSDKKIIELPDGTSCTTQEAYKWLIEQKETEEES